VLVRRPACAERLYVTYCFVLYAGKFNLCPAITR
jgi:hypothetical protein